MPEAEEIPTTSVPKTPVAIENSKSRRHSRAHAFGDIYVNASCTKAGQKRVEHHKPGYAVHDHIKARFMEILSQKIRPDAPVEETEKLISLGKEPMKIIVERLYANMEAIGEEVAATFQLNPTTPNNTLNHWWLASRRNPVLHAALKRRAAVKN